MVNSCIIALWRIFFSVSNKIEIGITFTQANFDGFYLKLTWKYWYVAYEYYILDICMHIHELYVY